MITESCAHNKSEPIEKTKGRTKLFSIQFLIKQYC